MSLNYSNIYNKLQLPVSSAILSGFRMIIGIMLLASIIRFAVNGWIYELYIAPEFYFKYCGFHWVLTWGSYTYLLFIICGLSALFFALGLFYRISSILLFLSFTYIELLDKTNYLNHYYFISLLLFIMIFLPANRKYALDVVRKPEMKADFIPMWTVLSIQLLLGIVYTYAGLAKLNSDWLISAMPLKIWLTANNHLPIIGPLLNEAWVAYLFSWFGAFYDLSIVIFLSFKRTRLLAYFTVIIFHVMTRILFPIGMFPFIMIFATLIFFKPSNWEWVMKKIFALFSKTSLSSNYNNPAIIKNEKAILLIFVVFFSIQIILPWRYLAGNDELFWTEQGYRFSWRVMLVEKMGYAQFVVKDANSNTIHLVNNSDFLTKNQEKMMATQTDFILQYASHLYRHYKALGIENPEIYADVFVGLNGRESKRFIDPNVNLLQAKQTGYNKSWILPSNIRIYGL